MTILGLIGEQGAGKGTVAEYLATKHNAKLFRFSKILDDILARLYIPNERTNIIALVTSLRGVFGEDLLAKVLAHDISVEHSDLNVFDGLRMPSEYETFKQVPEFKLIYVTAPIETRYQNVINRGEKANEAQLTFEKFKQTEEQAPPEIHIPVIAKNADYTIVNDSTKEDLFRKVDELIASL